MENKIIEYVMQLFTIYGWWSIALVGINFLLMIPINFGLKKAFAKSTSESASRIRKTLSSVLVFVVAGIVITIADLIFHIKFDISFILINCVPVGALSMIVWATYKFVRDCGGKALLNVIFKSNSIKKLLKKLPLDNKVAVAIYNKLVDMVKEGNGDNAEIVVKKEQQLVNIASTLLNGFVEVENITNVANQFVDALKLKFKVKGE